MATNTETLGLIQPEATDGFSIEHFNTNMAVLDADAKADAAIHAEISENLNEIDTDVDTANASLNSIAAKIGNSTDSGTSTVFGKLNGGSSPIRSIQYKIGKVSYSEPEATVTIDAVNTAKSFIVLERLYDSSGGLCKLEYTFNSTSLTLKGSAPGGQDVIYGFWIIEFN